jgi:hypothetical protein
MNTRQAVAGLLTLGTLFARPAATEPEPAPAAGFPEATPVEVETFCGSCHQLPAPDIFPAAAWPRAFETMAFLVGATQGDDKAATQASLTQMLPYFTQRAPQTIPVRANSPVSTKITFERAPLTLDTSIQSGLVTSLGVVTSGGRRNLILTQAPGASTAPSTLGSVVLRSLGTAGSQQVTLGTAASPVASEITDLDGDGVQDVLVADLGTFPAKDHARGAVIWLRGEPQGGFSRQSLLQGVGRVADTEVADIDEDGDLDIAVAIFGWHSTGQLLLFRQKERSDSATLRFDIEVLSPADGASHVRIADLDGDGDLDLIALFSQQFEKVVVYENDGNGTLSEEQILYQAPDPAWGSNGIELADLDDDGDADIILVAGDILDSFVLRPTHGVYWLENTGDTPFRPHPLGALPAASAIDVADLDGDGDLDIAATAFLPPGGLPDWTLGGKRPEDFDSVIWLEQTSRGVFKRHLVAGGPPRGLSLVVTDVDDDNRQDIVVGTIDHPTLEPSPLMVFRQAPASKE